MFPRLSFVASVAAATLVLAAPSGLAGTPSEATQPHSMWVWSDGAPAQLVDFATSHGLTRMYVFVTYDPDRAERRRLRDLHELADAEGIELDAMSGEPTWALRPNIAMGWLRDVNRLDVFAGIHLDVEPHALRKWKTDRTRVINGYLSLLDRVQQRTALPLRVDVPFWYGTIDAPGGKRLAGEVLARTDGVTVMTYRDTAVGPNALTGVAEDMLVRGDAAGIPVELAVETNQVPGCEHCTFVEEGEAAMLDAVAEVDEIETAAHVSYDGFSVEDFDGWRALKP